MNGPELLAAVTRGWRRRRVAGAALSALAVALPAAALVLWLPAPAGLRVLLLAATGAAVLAVVALAARSRTAPAAVAAHLDRRLPALQESAELLLAEEPLGPLAALQRRRLDAAAAALSPAELATLVPSRPLRRGALRLLAGGAAAALLLLAPRLVPAGERVVARPGATPAAASPPPLLRSLQVTVRPPAYTALPPRTGSQLGTRIEEGATVEWRVGAAPAATAAWLLLDESTRVELRRSGDVFAVARPILEPHLVRLVLGDAEGELWRSPPARLDVVPDRAPTVELLSPATLLERPAAGPGLLRLELAVADDHGVAAGELQLTLASGRDEQVEFRESRERLPLRPGRDRQLVTRTLDLAALGLTAGAELYVRAEVRDGRTPVANAGRSPTVIVRVPDPQRASVDLGEGLPALAGPELLRSQRQVLIDTERLVAEAPRLSRAEVDRRSRALAFDQRALRLRYGVLLGQEVEDGQVVEADEDHGPGGFGGEGHTAEGMGGVLGDFGHSHDSAESATFFPDPVRRKLVAMLGAMWDAERELATVTPRGALPHERRALELLKEVQQAARVYVGRSGAETTPLDPARRLGGDLEGVRQLGARAAAARELPAAAAATTLLGALDGGAPAAPEAVATARSALAEAARRGDATALAALAALDALAAGGELAAADRGALEAALWSLVPEPSLPSRRDGGGTAAWESYRRALGGEGAP